MFNLSVKHYKHWLLRAVMERGLILEAALVGFRKGADYGIWQWNDCPHAEYLTLLSVVKHSH